MPAFLTCDECGKDYLVPDEWIAEMPEEGSMGYRVDEGSRNYITTRCSRCDDLGYRATDAEKRKREE